MTSTTVDDLRTNLIGAWTLQSYEALNIDKSELIYPLGVDAAIGDLFAAFTACGSAYGVVAAFADRRFRYAPMVAPGRAIALGGTD